jgi:Predicted permease
MIKIFQSWLERYFADEEAVLVAVILIVSVVVVVSMGVVLAPMIAAIIIAFLMQGIVLQLKRWGASHTISVSLTFVVLAGTLLVCVVFLVPVFWRQLINLLNETPKMLVQGQQVMLLLPQQYPGLVTEEQVRELIGALRIEMTQWGQSILSFSVAQLPVLVGILIYMVLVPILVFFFLKDSEQMLQWFSSVLPRKRPVMRQIWVEMSLQIANYVRGKSVEIVIVAGVSSIAFSFLGFSMRCC